MSIRALGILGSLVLAIALSGCTVKERAEAGGGTTSPTTAAPSPTENATTPPAEPTPEPPKYPNPTIEVYCTTFETNSMNVTVGTMVSWKWFCGVHRLQVTAANGTHVIDQDFMGEGTAQRSFNEAGAYNYHCPVHPDTMNGTLTVTP